MVMDITRFLVIISRYIHILSHYVTHLKLMLSINYTSINKYITGFLTRFLSL